MPTAKLGNPSWSRNERDGADAASVRTLSPGLYTRLAVAAAITTSFCSRQLEHRQSRNPIKFRGFATCVITSGRQARGSAIATALTLCTQNVRAPRL
jgi:hypothetical protein